MNGKSITHLQNQIISDYKDGQGCVVIARKYGICHTSVLNILDANGIDRNKNKFARRTTKEQKRQIVEDYVKGMTLEEIGQKFLMDASNVSIIVKNRNIKIRTTAEANTISFDHSFFDIKNEKTAYFYGFVLGDGSYGLKGKKVKIPNLAISVHRNDVGILEMFCDWISMDKSHIHYSNKVKMNRLNIRNHCVSNNKEYWGVTANKTYKPILPKIDDETLLKPFLIGLLDADGSVSFGKRSIISLVGNTEIMDWFIESIKGFGYNGKIIQYKYDGKVWSRFCVCRKTDVIELATILDINKYDFILGRKWNDIKSVIERTSI